MFAKNKLRRQMFKGLGVAILILGIGIISGASAAGKPAIRVISPTDGQTLTSTDIPVTIQVSDFTISADHVGLPDKEGEGHIHVMIDGMNMGVLFNFYTTPSFTLPGDAISPGPHKLIFDLATNTHEDLADTAQEININYQPSSPKPAPAPAAVAGPPAVQIVSPADGATVGPKFTIEVRPTNLTPALGLEGKPNLAGYGHYHVFVDMNMSPSSESGGMMSMAGMILMPGSNTFNVDLSAWSRGKHTITVEPVQNDHTPFKVGKAAMVTINLQDAPAASNTILIVAVVALVTLIIVGALVAQRRRAAPRA